MMTIASGTFTAVDMGDAVIRSAGVNAACLMRINFVGIGRFAIALSADSVMGLSKVKHTNERIQLHSQMMALNQAKVFYQEESMWCEAENTYACLVKVSQKAEASLQTAIALHSQISDDIDAVRDGLGKLTETDPALASTLLDQLLFE